MTINGTNDAAVLGSAGLSVAETNAPIGASGMLSVTDVDDAPVFVPQTNVAGTYGTFPSPVTARGPTRRSAYDSLNLGQSVSDTFSVPRRRDDEHREDHDHRDQRRRRRELGERR